MFHDEVGFTGDQLHLEETEFGVDGIQLVDHRSKPLVFLDVGRYEPVRTIDQP